MEKETEVVGAPRSTDQEPETTKAILKQLDQIQNIEIQYSNAIRGQLNLIKSETEKLTRLRTRVENSISTDVIHVDVGGKKFTVSKKILLGEGGNQSHSYFQVYFSGRFTIPQPNSDGYYFIDRDPKMFSWMLDYLRLVNNPPEQSFSNPFNPELSPTLQQYTQGTTPLDGFRAKCQALEEEKRLALIDQAQFFEIDGLIELLLGTGIKGFGVFTHKYASQNLQISEDGKTVIHSNVPSRHEACFMSSYPLQIGHVYKLTMKINRQNTNGLFIGVCRWELRTWEYLSGIFANEAGYWADDLLGTILQMEGPAIFSNESIIEMTIDRLRGEITWKEEQVQQHPPNNNNNNNSNKLVTVSVPDLANKAFEVVPSASLFSPGMSIQILQVNIINPPTLESQ